MKNIVNKLNPGLITFRIGVLLLASAPLFAAIFFLFSLIISLLKEKLKIFQDKWNYLFMTAGFLMVLNALIHQLKYKNLSISSLTWYPSSSLIGLFNWIPLFLCFWGFQTYLNTFDKRKITSKILMIGSFPVLVSGFGQYWFDWYGPIEAFNGLIVWYQTDKFEGLTGLFNNPNYTACWLNVIWPFSIVFLIEKTKTLLVKASSLIFILSIGLAGVLTASRSGIGGLLLNIPLVLSPMNLGVIFTLISLSIGLILINILNIFPENINQILNSIFPANFDIFSHFFVSPDKVYGRDTILTFAIEMLSKSPILGLGASSFPIYYFIKNNIYIGHAHNLILDIAFGYGVIVAILVFINIFLLCFFSFRKIYLNNTKSKFDIYFERSWWASFFVLLCSQMVDVQYYDGRISIAFWILLSGLKCILEEESKNMIYTNEQN
tara:strand:- start:64784 stop:66088 length:1305 start_codon:yes stop_codon:yes gene_type:complete